MSVVAHLCGRPCIYRTDKPLVCHYTALLESVSLICFAIWHVPNHILAKRLSVNAVYLQRARQIMVRFESLYDLFSFLILVYTFHFFLFHNVLMLPL